MTEATQYTPFIIKNQIDRWGASHWTPHYLADQLKDIKFSCKIAPIHGKALWETECIHEEITLQQFVDWNDGKSREDNPLTEYDKEQFSCYIDYKYMKHLFVDRPDLLKEVDWSKFGFEGRDGSDSTIWIGSGGCYTNCHYDTYGFNLVAQIYGRKRWILFPPSDNLYPTRLPYEESSVFSQVDVVCPDLYTHSSFKHSNPHVIELDPGDVLFVPRHWWHYVECLETAISINTWVELEEDRDSHLNEAITRFLLTFLSKVQCEPDWINPGEELEENSVNFSYIQEAFSKLRSEKQGSCSNLQRFISSVKNLTDPGGPLIKMENGSTQCTNICNDIEFSLEKLGKRKLVNDIEKQEHKKLKVSETYVKNKDYELFNELRSHSSVHIVKPMLFDTYQREIIDKCNKNKHSNIIDDASGRHDCDNHKQREIIHETCATKQDIPRDSDYHKQREIIHETCATKQDIPMDSLYSVLGDDERKSDTEMFDGVKLESVDDSDNLSEGKSNHVSLQNLKQITQNGEQRTLTFETFVKSLLHPKVIDKIKDVLTSDGIYLT